MRNPGSGSSLRIWRGLALSSSALALALSLLRAPRDEWQASFGKAVPTASGAARGRTAVARPVALAGSAPDSLSAVTQLGEAGDEHALDALLTLARDATPEVTSAALKAIAEIGGDRAREFLAQRLTGAADSELPEIATALAILGDAEARAVLRLTAESPRPAARAAARDALATLDTADVRAFMLQDLGGPEPSQAASYFADCADPRAIPALERLARESESELSKAAIVALFSQGPSALGSIERLMREDGELSDAVLDAPTRTSAAHAALRAAAIQRLRAGAVTSGPIFDFLARDLASEARQALVQAARDPSTAESAIDALRTRGDSASMAALSQLADDSDPEVAGPAACALVSAPDSRSRAALLRASRGNLRGLAAAALLDINAPEASSSVASLGPDEQATIRRKAARMSRNSGLGS